MSKHAVVLFWSGVILILLAVWASSYANSQNVVRAQRLGCIRGGQNLALGVVNHIRIDEYGDQAVVRSAGVPPGVRKARKSELRRQDRQVLVIDSHIDRGEWHLLYDKRDQKAVRYGVHGHSPFRCVDAYPAASPFRFLR